MKEYFEKSKGDKTVKQSAIDKEVEWIHTAVLAGKPSKILHLGCGPGIHTHKLAQLGHECTGIDVSPAAIAHASETAEKDGLSCSYIASGIHYAPYGKGYDLIMMLAGEFNTLNPMDAIEVAGKLRASLVDGGRLVMELQSYPSYEKLGKTAPVWSAEKEGPFSGKPHLCLHENLWNPNNRTLMKRWYIVDAETAEVRLFARCHQSYSKPLIGTLLEKHDFIDIDYPASPTAIKKTPGDYFMVTAVKGKETPSKHVRPKNGV